MKHFAWKTVALLLALSLVLPLAACGKKPAATEKNTGTAKPEETPTPESTAPPQEENISFDGETLTLRISKNQGFEVTYRPADAYIKGPDETGENAVLNKVYNRNRVVARDLGINVKYQETDLNYDQVLDDIKKIVQADVEDAADIYNNDVYGMARAMLLNLFCNVIHPTDKDGNPEKSYFNFDHPCWYKDYMEGLTIDKDKQYILAGDFFLDILRMCWVLYVNIDLLDETFGQGGEGESFGYNQKELYNLVENRQWDYDTLKIMCQVAWRDGGEWGVADPEDDCLGLIWSHVFAFVLTPSAGQSVLGFDRNNAPCIIENNTSFFRFYEKLMDLYHGEGIYMRRSVLDSTVLFMKGNILFALSALGEMESEQMRNLGFAKSLVPIPIYDLDAQKEYCTITHDQSEMGAILSTSTNFTMASAYLQKISEASMDVMTEYYEKSLKLKYSEDAGTKKMLDIVHDTISSPFQIITWNAITSTAGVTDTSFSTLIQQSIIDKQTNFQSTYDAQLPVLKKILEKAISIYNGLN